MGYNASLYERQPIQFTVAEVKGNKHRYVRNSEWELNKQGWTTYDGGDGYFLFCKKYLPSRTAGKSNYEMLGWREVPESNARSVNAWIYDFLQQRDACGFTFETDPLFMHLADWIDGGDADVVPHKVKKLLVEFGLARKELMRKLEEGALDVAGQKELAYIVHRLTYNLRDVLGAGQ